MISDIYFFLYSTVKYSSASTGNGHSKRDGCFILVITLIRKQQAMKSERCNLLKHRAGLERNEHFDTFRVWATNVFHSLMVIMVERN